MTPLASTRGWHAPAAPFQQRAGRGMRAAHVLAVVLVAAAPMGAQAPLTLAQVVELAQKQGFAATAAVANREAARQRDRAFVGRQLPQFSLTANLPAFSRSIQSVTQPDGSQLFVPTDNTRADLGILMTQAIPFTGGSFFVASSITRLDVSRTTSVRSWNATPYSIGFRQDLFRPGSLAFDASEQELRYTSAERQYLEAREDIALAASQAFFALYTARMGLANATANAAVNDTLYTLNKGRFEVGKIGENDLLQSELALLRARNALDQARLDLARAEAALRLVLNVAPGARLDIAVSAEVPAVHADTITAVAQALRNRSQMTDFELAEAQARRRVTESRWSNGLSAVVSASMGTNATSPVGSTLYQNPLEQQALQVQLSVPFFQSGARSAEVQAAKASVGAVQANARAAREQAAQDAHFAVLQLEQSRRQLAVAAKADTVANKRYEVAYNRYVIGRIAIDNLFLAQSEKDAALQAYVGSLAGFWNAYYRLRRVTLFDFVAQKQIRP